ncbi:multiple inositol polyphosphate phosphatase 1 precursor, putative [Entamoeba invadens IP1]|uniref:Multiple inositol polyphosphate phosphatase 1 n=1 Tax=Entamoeba invadens IP1 TaxID=370355 RepID=A0A0A1U097_ENTIV|nr:multiple inositol polyphosphate phosphatase 1 precursor, putative [Entamoeba invadens IP1]ELP87304.1 multiple inositol polyphosphate phosphatase 1 precursor, putative [Entamoeba invadens IP1]|eukprot:XP_004254075.1 multiple inositol polyphosphate phosphatase 1 precursor, putative [Entamoeba invadens IP1]
MLLSVFLFTILCRSEDVYISKHFATATPYPQYYKRDPTIDHYEVIYSELVSRHGARYPTEKNTLASIALSELLNSKSHIKWDSPFTLEKQGQLCERGEDELLRLGTYYKTMLNSLYKGKGLSLFNVSATAVPRAQDSAVYWMKGFSFDEPENLKLIEEKKMNITVAQIEDDMLLYFHKCCQKYIKYKKLPSTKAESKSFMEAAALKISKHFVSQTGLTQITQEETLEATAAAFNSAVYEYIVFNKTNGLLKYFSVQDAEVFEYAKDLETYFTKSVSTALNYKMAIPLLHTILEALRNAMENNKEKHKQIVLGNFRFAHAETVTPLMVLLGIKYDKYPLTAKLPLDLKINRQWKMSELSPFSTHLMFVVLKDKTGNYYVRTYMNQRPVVVPPCPSSTICEAETFLKYYYNVTRGFDFNAFCEN